MARAEKNGRKKRGERETNNNKLDCATKNVLLMLQLSRGQLKGGETV